MVKQVTKTHVNKGGRPKGGRVSRALEKGISVWQEREDASAIELVRMAVQHKLSRHDSSVEMCLHAESAIANLSNRCAIAAEHENFTEVTRLAELVARLQAQFNAVEAPGGYAVAPGKHVLKNLGNTCFLNCCLAAISHNPLLRPALMMTSRFAPTLREMTVPQKLTWAVKEYLDYDWSSSTSPVFMPDVILRWLRLVNADYIGTNQHDAALCLRDMLQAFDAASGVVTQIFEMTQSSILTCTVCGFRSEKLDRLCELPLAIPEGDAVDRRKGSLEIQGLLEDYFNTTVLDGEDKWLCPRCSQRQVATKSVQLAALPECVILHVQRSQCSQLLGSFRVTKAYNRVTFPLTQLTLSPYCMNVADSADAVFNLASVQAHVGQDNAGHWVAKCRHGPCGGSGEWFLHDDSKPLVPVSEDDVACTEASILIYSRQPCAQGQRWAQALQVDTCRPMPEVALRKSWCARFQTGHTRPGPVEVVCVHCVDPSQMKDVEPATIIGLQWFYGGDWERLCPKCRSFMERQERATIVQRVQMLNHKAAARSQTMSAEVDLAHQDARSGEVGSRLQTMSAEVDLVHQDARSGEVGYPRWILALVDKEGLKKSRSAEDVAMVCEVFLGVDLEDVSMLQEADIDDNLTGKPLRVKVLARKVLHAAKGLSGEDAAQIQAVEFAHQPKPTVGGVLETGGAHEVSEIQGTLITECTTSGRAAKLTPAKHGREETAPGGSSVKRLREKMLASDAEAGAGEAEALAPRSLLF